jgi:hypothetical protein
MKLDKSINKYNRDIKSVQKTALFMKLDKSINEYTREKKVHINVVFF